MATERRMLKEKNRGRDQLELRWRSRHTGVGMKKMASDELKEIYVGSKLRHCVNSCYTCHEHELSVQALNKIHLKYPTSPAQLLAALLATTATLIITHCHLLNLTLSRHDILHLLTLCPFDRLRYFPHIPHALPVLLHRHALISQQTLRRLLSRPIDTRLHTQ